MIDLTLNQQAYIEAVYDLCEEHGHAHTKSIAEKLDVKMASVSEAIKALAAKGLVNYEVRKTITLTEEGHKIALELDKRHSILADFFHNILGCPKMRSEKIACRIEHVIDEDFRVRLANFVCFLKNELPGDGPDPIKEFQKKYNSGKLFRDDS